VADYSSTTELDEFQRTSRSVRRKFEPQWFLNIAYYNGKQWVFWDGNKIFEPVLHESRFKVTDNRIRGNVRTDIAKMTKARPVWVGVPKDDSDEEQAAARLRERAYEHYWRELDMTRKRRAGLLWSRVCGAGFLKTWWDSTLGGSKKVLVGPDGKSVKDQYGAPLSPGLPPEQLNGVLGGMPPDYAQQVKPQTVAMGDLRVEVRSPFNIFPDPLSEEDGLETSAWLIDESVFSVEYVRSRFGKELEADARTSAGALESRMPLLDAADGEGKKQGVRVREFWAKASSDYPNGKHCVWAQEQILLEEDNPYPWLPYAMFRGVLSPGRFWPAGVDDQISPQTELNKRKAQVAENADRIGNSPLMRSAANESFDWQGQPGEEIVYQDLGTDSSVPRFLQVPELGAYIREDIDRCIDALREISGQHEVSSGTVPAGVTAASAINLLQEQDDTRLGPEIEDMEVTLTDAGQRVLWMLRNFADDQRMIRIAGEEGAWELRAFRGEDLKDCDNDAVQAGSGLPQSKAAKQAALQEVLNMFAQAQVPLSERDLRKVLQEYQIGGLEKFFATAGNDERQIQRENMRLASGDQFPTNVYDDDELHLEGHMEFQKSATYEETIRANPAIGQTFEQHVDEHRQKVVQAQDLQQQQQMQQVAAHSAAAAPTPPPGNGSGPPGAVPSGQPSTGA
jgi:hypothetical protein